MLSLLCMSSGTAFAMSSAFTLSLPSMSTCHSGAPVSSVTAATLITTRPAPKRVLAPGRLPAFHKVLINMQKLST